MRRGAIAALLAALLAGCGAAQTPQPSPTPAFRFEGGGATDLKARIAHGERLARVLACRSCHGDNLQGSNVTADDPDFGEMNAPNVTLMLGDYSDAQLDRLIRHGEPRDGHVFWFMASEGFQYLGDQDLADLIAYLRTVPTAGKPMPPIRFGPGFRRAQASGEMEPAQKLVARFRVEGPVDLGADHAYGRWLTRTVCAECHNASLQGYPDFTPNLDIAGAYTPAELERLLTTGQGKTGRNLGMMAATARGRLFLLTPRERAAIIAYVLARARHDMAG